MPALAVATRPTDDDTDDRDLVVGVRAGDDRAFEILFQRYQRRIAAYVYRIVRDHGRAEDITQEVFIAALRRMREETEREILFKPWIYEIAKNKCIDAFRRTRNASEISFDARDAIGADEHGRLAEPGATPDSAIEGKVAIDNLRGAFGGLSPVHHQILVLRELEGLSYRDIGERLGMSRAGVESTLFRARKRLSEEYEELISGERCLRVQRTVDACGGRSAGLRDQRRMARHLAHCQACRRYAGRAGVELGSLSRPAAAAERIAGLIALPSFLRRPSGDDDDAAPLIGQGGPLDQWSANVAPIVDPGLVSSWTKVVATAATVAVAGIGAGSALPDRVPAGGVPSADARLERAAGAGTAGPAGASAAAGGRTERVTAATAPAGFEARAPHAADRAGSGGRARATTPAAPATPAGTRANARQAPSRAVGSRPADRPALRRVARAVAEPPPVARDAAAAVGGVLDSVAAAGGQTAAAGSSADDDRSGLVEDNADRASAVAGTVAEVPTPWAAPVSTAPPAVTGRVASVSSTVSEAPSTTTAPHDLGG
ncbi:MAG: sigma-70 family RNA polymerase sigma factor [Thermoleophilia bacterium]